MPKNSSAKFASTLNRVKLTITTINAFGLILLYNKIPLKCFLLKSCREKLSASNNYSSVLCNLHPKL
ncbi:hypothetical protein BpHYR1_034037 [Brachionus plicatilis]|uniref:Uncharacterized protein n=1 Tax=Brachionus plicatilis TaxID=10195 RepID=A0A3M7P5H6_BRAPC|nr:hypothetical protein BpHYR1_034037 [Brachionus plicatilis]